MARNDVYLNINSLSPADAVVTGQQDMTAATIPELVLGDTPTFNFYFTDNTNVWPSWAGNAAYTLTWALSDAVAGDFAPAATTGNATPITGGWSVVLPLNSYDLVGLLNTKRVGQPYPVQNLWQQLRVTDPSGNEITRAMVWTPVRYRAISDTQNTESASPTGGRFVTVNNVNELTTPTDAQFYAANPVPTSALGTASNGQLFIGNGTGFTKATLTAGTGVAITNGSGSITIDATNAQELLTATVTNAEATPITKGQVVYIFGATGNRPSVKLAYNTQDATSAKTFGVVSDASIAAGGTGTVTCVGVVDGLNLGTYNDGDTVYLGATPGSITATKPYAPNHLVYVGIIERANSGNGELYVRIQNGYELDEIHDVQILTPPAAGAVLVRDNTNSLWKAAQISGTANQITVTNADAAVTLSIPTAVTNVNSLTAQSATNLTLNGGSSGASLVLGQGTTAGGFTLTPTGTGGVTLQSGASNGDVLLKLRGTSANPNGTIRWTTSTDTYTVGIGSRFNVADNGLEFLIGSTTTGMNLRSNGNFLVGTTVDSGAKLQVGTNTTTSAGGMIFGTDTSFYRAGNGFLHVDTSTGNNPAIKLSISGTAYGWLEYYAPDNGVYLTAGSGKSLILRTNGGTTALTLTSAQQVQVNASTASSSTTTGALVVSGGVGVAGAINVGGNIGLSGNFTITDGVSGHTLTIDRQTTAQNNYLKWSTAGTQNWVFGSGATGTNTDLELYSYGASGRVAKFDYSTKATTLDGNLTVSGGDTTVSAGKLKVYTGNVSSWQANIGSGANSGLYINGLATTQTLLGAGMAFESPNWIARGGTTASGYHLNAGAHAWYGDTGLTDGASFTPTLRMSLSTAGNLTLTGSLTTSAPTGGAGAWELGVYSATAPTATGYVTIEIGGVQYKLLAST